MPKPVKDILEQFKGLPKGRQAAFGAAAALVLAAIIFSIAWLNRTDYELLYSNLTPEDAGLIMQKLDDQKIPYKATANGLMVPADKVALLRLRLAGEGLPQNGGVGFEIFDKNSLTTTDFVQKIDYKRALQGELARTIRSISGIELCRVQLVIPDNTDFLAENKEKPRASVLLKLAAGRNLSQGQVQGIMHLVASSVEGLDPGDVSIVDSQGNILNSPQDENTVLTGTQLEYERTVEKQLESRVAGILEPVVGPENVKVRVAADIDFTRMDKTEENYDPDSQVARSQQSIEENSTSAAPGGVPGAASNLPGKSPVAPFMPKGLNQKKNETINYEISKVTSHIENATGMVRRLSVVALVDGSYKTVNGKKQYIPRSDQELKQFEDMVKQAVGFDAAKGDQVKVVNMPFNSTAEEELASEGRKPSVLPAATSAMKHLAPMVLILLVFLFVVRPLMKTLARQARTEEPVQQLREETLKLLEQQERKQIEEEGAAPQKRVITWAKDNPKEAAFMIENWIEEK